MASGSTTKRRPKQRKKKKVVRLGDLELGDKKREKKWQEELREQKEQRREIRQRLKGALAVNSVPRALEVLVLASEDPDTSDAASELLLPILRLVASRGKEADYRQALWLCTKMPFQLMPDEFMSLLNEHLAKKPVRPRSVRMTLNLAIPRDGQVLPTEPEGDSTPDSPKAAPDHEEEELYRLDAAQAARMVGPPLSELCGRVGVYDRDVAPYFGHFCTLVGLQHLSDIEDMENLWRQPVKDLEVAGLTIRNLQVVRASQGRVTFAPPGDFTLDKFRYKAGESVIVSKGHTGPLKCKDSQRAAGILVQVDGQLVVVGQFLGVDLNEGGVWRMDKAPNATAFTRETQALVKLAMARDCERRPLMEIIAAMPDAIGITKKKQWARRVFRAAIEREAPEDIDDNAIRAPISRMEQLACQVVPLQGCHDGKLKTVRKSLDKCQLNSAQREAVEAALGRRLTLVQGPPGTGKTHVACHLLKLWSHYLKLKPILATSDSNVAVDNIAEGLARIGVKVVRIGMEEKISSSLHDFTMETHVRAFRKTQDRTIGDWGSASPARNLKLLHIQHNEIDMKERKRILMEAEVVCATTTTAGSLLFEDVKFGAILVDEVAQATEPTVMVPIVRGQAERVVLVGDHCQLPPTVSCQEADQRGLSLSLFSRLVGCGIEPFFLDTQFRMHPMIAEHSSKEFYGGKLRTGIPAERRPPPQGFRWPRQGCGVAFLDTLGQERDEGSSHYNMTEVDTLIATLAGILAAGELKPQEIGIITPYSAQVRCLKKKIAVVLGRHLQEEPNSPSTRDQGGLEVASVDAFQGREKELIIISTVRSNPWGRVGFLKSWRRMNVMLTRARRGVIVIGDSATLCHDPSWERWLQWVEKSGFQVSR